jgi:carbon-monoxide dehydrogenase catalytic subunit
MAEEKQAKSIDQATNEMLAKAAEEKISTAFDRADKMKPCPIGADGSCCKNCAMGPCRVPPPRNKVETPEERKARVGVCGATAETIAARNFARMIAAGTASHSDHGRRVVEAFKLMAEGKTKDFEIKDEQKAQAGS